MWCRRLAFATLVFTLFSDAFQAQQANQSVSNFPDFRLIAGKVDQNENPLSAARLCLAADSRKCFKLPQTGSGDDAFFYYWHPKADRILAKSGETLIFFSASFRGGSGGSDEFVLLRYEQNAIKNLLPPLTLTNQSDHALWSIPSLSSMPLLVTADFLWQDGEVHYGSHYFEICAYRYDPQTAKYRRVIKYRTHLKYKGFDNSDRPFPTVEP